MLMTDRAAEVSITSPSNTVALLRTVEPSSRNSPGDLTTPMDEAAISPSAETIVKIELERIPRIDFSS
jgi:hypothetical protein